MMPIFEKLKVKKISSSKNHMSEKFEKKMKGVITLVYKNLGLVGA